MIREEVKKTKENKKPAAASALFLVMSAGHPPQVAGSSSDIPILSSKFHSGWGDGDEGVHLSS